MGMALFPSDKDMLIDGIQALMSALGEDMTIAKRKELLGKSTKELEELYDSLENKVDPIVYTCPVCSKGLRKHVYEGYSICPYCGTPFRK